MKDAAIDAVRYLRHNCGGAVGTSRAMSADSKQDGGAAGAAWREDKKSGLLENIARTGDFWRRTMGIYAAYKATQVRAALLRLQGKDDETINAQVWTPQHQWAGEQMYDLCVSLRGFYLKAGQFIGARGDFVPEPICRKLSLLHDRVPPMPPAKAKEILTRELGVSDLGDVFEWIDLETPLGSASISQVHKGQLKRFSADELSAAQRAARGRALTQHTVEHVVRDGETAWDIANLYGVSVDELEAANRQGKGRSSYCQVDWLHPGQRIRVPSLEGLNSTEGSDKQSAPSNSSSSSSGSGAAARAAVLHAVSSGLAPQDGLVAVKIQYPDALGAMTLVRQEYGGGVAFAAPVPAPESGEGKGNGNGRAAGGASVRPGGRC